MAAIEEAGVAPAALRVGAACGIAGAVVLLVSNVTHPRPPRAEVGDHEAFLQLAADSGAWLAIHLAILLGTLLLFGGLVALSYSLRVDGAAWPARAALVVAVVGTSVGVVQHSIDAAYGKVADDWAAATGPDRESLLRVGGALEDVDFTLLSVNVVVFFGVTFVLFGTAVAASRAYPDGLGWIAVAAGVAGIAVGIVQFFTGPSDATLFVFPAVAAVLSLWVLVMGVLVWRRAAGGDAAAPEPVPRAG